MHRNWLQFQISCHASRASEGRWKMLAAVFAAARWFLPVGVGLHLQSSSYPAPFWSSCSGADHSEVWQRRIVVGITWYLSNVPCHTKMKNRLAISTETEESQLQLWTDTWSAQPACYFDTGTLVSVSGSIQLFRSNEDYRSPLDLVARRECLGNQKRKRKKKRVLGSPNYTCTGHEAWWCIFFLPKDMSGHGFDVGEFRSTDWNREVVAA